MKPAPLGLARLSALVSALLLFSGCDQFQTPNRPVPERFSAQTVAGAPLDAASFRGRPHVVAVWVPG